MVVVVLIILVWFFIGVASLSKLRTDEKGRWRLFGLLLKDIVNPVKWWSYIKGTVYGIFLKPHILEQVLIRQLNCEECVLAGKCVDCGCSMPAKTYDMDARCSLDKWGPVDKKAKEWNQRKKDYKIKLSVSYGE